MRFIYMDHGATTPVSPKALERMLPWFTEMYGNPSSDHDAGRRARAAIETARAQTAAAIGAEPREIYFTSGGTESNNWAIKGMAFAGRRKSGGRHIITTAIEHHSVLNTAGWLEQQGFLVTYLSVDADGFVDPAEVEQAIGADTLLISVMAANNEIGTIEPVQEIGEIARSHGIPFHTDAVQAIGNLRTDVNEWQADLLSLSAHKFYGPKGAGALYIRRGIVPDHLIHGGTQERGRRSGTENVPGIVGLGCAISDAAVQVAERKAQESPLRDRLIHGIRELLPESRLNGSAICRLPGNVNISFPGVDQQVLLRQLELRGILASAGAACTSGLAEPSHVLQALKLPWEYVAGAIRFSLGMETTEEEVDTVLAVIADAVRDAQNIQQISG